MVWQQYEYVSFETAKLLQEKNIEFNIHTFYNYKGEIEEHTLTYLNKNSGEYYAPTQSLVLRWLREECDIYVMIDKDFATTDGWHYYIATKETWNYSEAEHIQQESNNYSFEYACEEAIKYCLNNLI